MIRIPTTHGSNAESTLTCPTARTRVNPVPFQMKKRNIIQRLGRASPAAQETTSERLQSGDTLVRNKGQ